MILISRYSIGPENGVPGRGMVKGIMALATSLQANLIPLPLLQPGQRARIEQVVGWSELVRRLGEMGLRDGARVEMVRPGTPCMIRLGNQKLGLRADELSGVLVRVEALH